MEQTALVTFLIGGKVGDGAHGVDEAASLNPRGVISRGEPSGYEIHTERLRRYL